MGVMLDYISSAIIFGILVLTLARVQGNLNAATQQGVFNLTTQRNGINLARQIESDFLRIGHHVKGQMIFAADTSLLTFRADLWNNGDTVLVQYRAGSPAQSAFTSNPYDFPLFRRERGVTMKQHFGLTGLKFTFYDSVNTQISTPISHPDSLKKIRAIDVRFTVMNPEPVITIGDTIWSAITWEKTLIPRNITKVSL